MIKNNIRWKYRPLTVDLRATMPTQTKSIFRYRNTEATHGERLVASHRIHRIATSHRIALHRTSMTCSIRTPQSLVLRWRGAFGGGRVHGVNSPCRVLSRLLSSLTRYCCTACLTGGGGRDVGREGKRERGREGGREGGREEETRRQKRSVSECWRQKQKKNFLQQVYTRAHTPYFHTHYGCTPCSVCLSCPSRKA